MGESLVETPKVGNKMGESVTTVPCLQQSVSFGRFEHDSLCWERWSTFPTNTNKYLEEVEKCSTPGSVAQKKTYFEAHYKKIAARRAELLLEQEKEREAELGECEYSSAMSPIYNIREEELDNAKPDSESSGSETDQLENSVGSFDGEVSFEHFHVKKDTADVFNLETEEGGFDSEMIVDHVCAESGSADFSRPENIVTDLPCEGSEPVDGTLKANVLRELANVLGRKCDVVDEFKDGNKTIREVSEVVKIEVTEDNGELNDGADYGDEVVISEVTDHIGGPDVGADRIKETDKWPQEELSNLCLSVETPESDQSREPVLVTEDLPSPLESKCEELPQEKVKRTIIEEERKNLKKSAGSKKMQATLVKKTTSTTDARKKLASPIPKRSTAPMPKSPMLSTPKSSKPELSKVTKSASRLVDKKENAFTPLTSKRTTRPQSKRLGPTSLHMSLSLGPMNSDPTSLTRKSLIMERMGDKDIVKRAFKSFQSVTQKTPTSLAEPPAQRQSASKKAEQKGSPSNSFLKKNEGIRRTAKTISTRTPQGTSKALSSLGVNKNGVTGQGNVKSVAASFGPRVQLQQNNPKDVSKKLDLKPRTNVLDATRLQSKLKMEKFAQSIKPSQGLNPKSKLTSSYNRGLAGSVQKGDGKIQASG